MIKYILMFTTALSLTACSSQTLFEPWEEEQGVDVPVANLPTGSVYMVEQPYEVSGVWYFPKENYDYSEKGLASWYMPANGGVAKTANGEEYIATELSARHKTLPLPSIVKITNLENNKTIIARVNDRGPMVNNRLIDVSQRAAEELGLPVTGTNKVLVEVLPKESQAVKDALIVAGRIYKEQKANDDLALVPPMPVPEVAEAEGAIVSAPVVQEIEKPVQVYSPKEETARMAPVAGGTYIQLGAFGNAANAAKAEQKAAQVTQVVMEQKEKNGRVLSVLKAGPFADRAEAARALQQLKAAGYKDAYLAK